MPIPAVISDLSPIIGTGPSPNGGQPGGGENPSTFDDYLRAYGAFIAQLRAGSGFANSGAFRIPFFDASGAWSSSADFVRNASGLVGIGVAPSANTSLTVRTAAQTDSAFAADNGVNTGFRVQFAANLTSVGNDFNNPLAFLTNNTERMRIDASGNVGIGTASPGTSLHIRSAALAYPLRVQTTAGSTAGIEFEDPGTGTNRPNIASRGTSLSIETNSAERMRIDATGHQINTPGSTTPPTLTVNGQLNITPTSNTNVRISFRGTDGVTRTANITLT